MLGINTQNTSLLNYFMTFYYYYYLCSWGYLHWVYLDGENAANGGLLYVSSQLHIQGCHIDSLRSATCKYLHHRNR